MSVEPTHKPTEAELEGIDDENHPAVQKNGLYVLAEEADIFTVDFVNEAIEEGVFDPNVTWQGNLRRLSEWAEDIAMFLDDNRGVIEDGDLPAE